MDYRIDALNKRFRDEQAQYEKSKETRMPKKLYLGRGTIQEANAKKSAERAEKRKQKKEQESKEKER